MSRPLLIALALLVLPSCGQDPKAADEPSAGDLAITGEEKSAQANAEQQVAAAVAVAQSRTLDARVARLEAEVDALKAEAATSESLKSALADIGSTASAPPPLPLVMPHRGDRDPIAAPPPLPTAVALAPTMPVQPAPPRAKPVAPIRKPPRGASPAAELQARLAPHGVLKTQGQPKLGYSVP